MTAENTPTPKPGDQMHATRRSLLAALTATGVGSAGFCRSLAHAAAAVGDVTSQMIQDAEWVAGIHLTEDQRTQIADSVRGLLAERQQLRSVDIEYDTLPAVRFDPEMYDRSAVTANHDAISLVTESDSGAPKKADVDEPDSWLSIRQSGHLLRNGKVTAVQLAETALQRLQEVDPRLFLVVRLTRELALQQAEQADRELAMGTDRGPLHGIPWGAKDLIAVRGYPTTWGAPAFKNRTLKQQATVAARMQQAGAVLVAKLSLGALAMGDRWFGGQTRNPWNPDQGSSGSSAGSAAAVASGALAVTLGSETQGSIVSPCRRCGVTGLRPTFGRVSRHGCMSLSWTMDKIGPIARTVDDCGLVLQAILGRDPKDPVTVDRWFAWPRTIAAEKLKVGRPDDDLLTEADKVVLKTFEDFGAQIVPVKLPHDLPVRAVTLMLDAEAAEVFHDLIVNDSTEGLNAWPDIFRKLHFLPAVDYLRAARVRSLLMQRMAVVMKDVHLYVGGRDLAIANLTGHPTLALPAMISEDQKHPQPVCSTLTGRLYDETTLLAAGAAVENALQLQRPPLPL